jgi:hypothetical protein
MAAEDFLTNVESAFLALFADNNILKQYNWQRWDDDKEADLPRGAMALAAVREPEDTPYHKVQVVIQFEGRPKKQRSSVVVNELKDLLETKNTTDLDAASGNTVTFMGHALAVSERRDVKDGLRVWTFGFVIYALPMV